MEARPAVNLFHPPPPPHSSTLKTTLTRLLKHIIENEWSVVVVSEFVFHLILVVDEAVCGEITRFDDLEIEIVNATMDESLLLAMLFLFGVGHAMRIFERNYDEMLMSIEDELERQAISCEALNEKDKLHLKRLLV